MTIEVSDKTGDELSELSVYYNKMRMKLNDTIQTVQQSALQLASASQQLSAGAEETNQASEKSQKLYSRLQMEPKIRSPELKVVKAH